MPTSLVLPTAVQLRLHWLMNGVDCYNVIGGQVAGSLVVNQTLANALGTAFAARLTSSGLAALLATTTSLVSVGIRDIRTANQPEFVSAAAAVPGTGVGNPLPNEVALCVTLRTALAGRSFRGRIYLGGYIVAENDTAGRIAPFCNTTSVAFVTGIQTDMATSAITLAVLSRPRPASTVPPLPAYAGAVTPVTAVTARDTLWDAQRRRKR